MLRKYEVFGIILLKNVIYYLKGQYLKGQFYV